MRAAKRFVLALIEQDRLLHTESITTKLYGSLALTGIGHGTDKAILLGLTGSEPETVDPDAVNTRVEEIYRTGVLQLAGIHPISFADELHLLYCRSDTLPLHSNAIRFSATDLHGTELLDRVYYSTGGGFIADEAGYALNSREPTRNLPYPFNNAAELLDHAAESGLSISGIALQNELCTREHEDLISRLRHVWQVMQDCVRSGCARDGILPGGLDIERRAPALYRDLTDSSLLERDDPLNPLDWVNVYAMAVSEENAAGGRVVTAPTNGAAGIIPAVLHYYDRFCEGSTNEGVVRFFLTAGAICSLYKRNASLSGAEVGCQGEVGVACSMAAGALTEAMGGRPKQVESAAEIAMEHNLGLTCDPVGGLVQIPCIERNAVGAVKAIHASRLALRGDGNHRVSLDQVIETMQRTGKDMNVKYKETSRGGLAVNVTEC